MPEEKRTAAATPAAAHPEPKHETKPKGPLARASEASDPAVHHAMAVLDGALMNRAALETEEADVKAADEQVEAARKALADLGYE